MNFYVRTNLLETPEFDHGYSHTVIRSGAYNDAQESSNNEQQVLKVKAEN
jgi:hypothetical protein